MLVSFIFVILCITYGVKHSNARGADYIIAHLEADFPRFQSQPQFHALLLFVIFAGILKFENLLNWGKIFFWHNNITNSVQLPMMTILMVKILATFNLWSCCQGLWSVEQKWPPLLKALFKLIWANSPSCIISHHHLCFLVNICSSWEF